MERKSTENGAPLGPEMPGGCNRRQFLWRLGLGLASVSALGVLQSCGLLDDSELAAVSLTDLKAKGFWTGEFNGEGVFIGLDAKGQPYALSLICTHKQCTVEYRPDDNEFICPCHKGRYDAKGNVLRGKPPKPLPRFSTEVREGTVWLLDKAPKPTS